MEKLKYDSLYKFIVSIGIVIIILPFIFIFSLLNNNDIILVKENDINQLTNTAKDIILLEQNYKYIILSNPIIFTVIVLIFFIVGFLIVWYGIIQWKDKVQKYEDKSRKLSNKLLEKQIKSLTIEEKEEKIKKDIEISGLETQSNKSNNFSNRQQIFNYINIQEKVYKIIRKEFKNYKIFEEVRLEKQMYDCIALDTSDYASYDYIFEIKYFSTIKAIKGKIKKLELMMLEKELLYYNNSKRNVKTILIIIVENFSEKDQLENKKLLDEIKKKNNNMTQIIVTDINGIDKILNDFAKNNISK